MQECRQAKRSRHGERDDSDRRRALGARAGRPRILYALGPGNVVDAYRKWNAGPRLHDRNQPHLLQPVFRLLPGARSRGVGRLVASGPRSCPRRPFTVENRPKRFADPRGLLFHLNQVLYGFSIIVVGPSLPGGRVDRRFGHDALVRAVALVAQSHPRRLPRCTIRTGPAAFCRGGAIKRAIRTLDGWFWRHTADATLCVSPECQRQVEWLAGRRQSARLSISLPVSTGRLRVGPAAAGPRRAPFPGDVRRPRRAQQGRVRPARNGRGFQARVAGPPANRDLRRRRGARRTETDDRRTRPGRGRAHSRQVEAARAAGGLRPTLTSSIVPTRSTFCEGMPMVAAEAVLSGRPVLTSRLSNALDVSNGPSSKHSPTIRPAMSPACDD